MKTQNTKRKGIILAGGMGSRLFPITHVVSKQLLPVYDKPMIYYPLTTLMLAGMREILLISTPHDLPSFKRLLGDGSQWGIEISYAEQPKPEGIAQALIIAEEFLDGSPSCLILGDNLFFGGKTLELWLDEASSHVVGSTIFAYDCEHPENYGVVEFDHKGKVLSIEEKPENPKSDFVVTGLYFYDTKAPEMVKAQKPSARGELEITDLNKTYLEMGHLTVKVMSARDIWMDAGTPNSLLEAADFIKTSQQVAWKKTGCPEAVALTKGFITRDKLNESVAKYAGTPYGQCLATI